jgi:hypothetical protein
MSKACSHGCQLVDVPRLYQLLPVTTDVSVAQVIGHDEDDVGTLGGAADSA